MQYVNFDFNNFKSNSPYGSTFVHIATQPKWVWKIPFTAAMLVLCIPLAIFAVAALLTFLLLFSALSLINRIIIAPFTTPRKTSTTTPQQTNPQGFSADGRENVRIIDSHK